MYLNIKTPIAFDFMSFCMTRDNLWNGGFVEKTFKLIGVGEYSKTNGLGYNLT